MSQQHSSKLKTLLKDLWEDVPFDTVAIIKGGALAMLLAKSNINQVNGNYYNI